MKQVIFVFFALCTVLAAGKEKPEQPYTLPVLTSNMAERLAQIAKVTYQGPNNNTRCGDGFSGAELFELHRELRRLVHENLDKAPTAREFEILKLLLCGKPDRKIDCRAVLNRIRQRTEKKEFDNLFYDGYDVNRLMIRYRSTGDRRYLDNAVVMADFVMANHDARLGDRAAYEKWAAHHCWLGLGRGYGGICELILAIVKAPKLHNATAIAGDRKASTETYIDRARKWMASLQGLIDFRRSNDKYDNGKWYETEKEVNYKGGPAATNRYLYYLHFLCAAADAAEALDPVVNKEWAAVQRRTVREALGWFQRSCCRPKELHKGWWKGLIAAYDKDQNAYKSEYGLYDVWAYKPGRQTPEDYIHLYMDMEAFDDIFRHMPDAIAEPFLRKMAVAFIICTYDYKTGYIPFNLGPGPGNKNPLTQPPWHTYFCPIYGRYIGRYLGDKAYNKFIKQSLLIWDGQLLKGRLGRFSQYPMPKEITEARYYRYNKQAPWPVPNEKIMLPDHTARPTEVATVPSPASPVAAANVPKVPAGQVIVTITVSGLFGIILLLLLMRNKQRNAQR